MTIKATKYSLRVVVQTRVQQIQDNGRPLFSNNNRSAMIRPITMKFGTVMAERYTENLN